MRILYIHGLGSSGNSRTVEVLRELLPNDEIIAPDIPFDPEEAMTFIRELDYQIKPDIVVGTSLGGYYTMQLCYRRKILINPALFADEDICNSIGLGIYQYFSKRKDNVQTYTIDKGFIEKLRIQREWFFNYCMLDDEYSWHCTALFADNDELFSHIDDYKNLFHGKCISFRGNHRMTEDNIKNILLPQILKVINE